MTYRNKIIVPKENSKFLPFYEKSGGENYEKLSKKVETIICQNYYNSELKNNKIKIEGISKNNSDCFYLHLIVLIEQRKEFAFISKANNPDGENKIENFSLIKKQF